jgi:hypothetical protein
MITRRSPPWKGRAHDDIISTLPAPATGPFVSDVMRPPLSGYRGSAGSASFTAASNSAAASARAVVAADGSRSIRAETPAPS